MFSNKWPTLFGMDAILSGSLESVRFLIEEAHFPFEMHSKRGAATLDPAH